MAWARCERSIHYTPSAASRLLSCLSSIPPASPFRYCRARAHARIWDTVFHYRVHNKSFVPLPPPATDIGENSDLETALFVHWRVSLVMFPRETTSHLTRTLTNVFVGTSAKLRAERTRFKSRLHFVTIGSIRRATCLETETEIASLIRSDS